MNIFKWAAQNIVPNIPIVGEAVSFINGSLNRHAQKENNKRIAEQNAAAMDFQAEQNLQNMAFNREEAEKSRAFNAQQAQLAFEREAKFNKEMWEKENAYNSPSAQVQRLIDAGINPNVFGGQNTAGSVAAAASSAASSNPASANLGGTPSLHAPSPVSWVNPMLEAAQIRLANASAKKAENEAERTEKLLPGEVKIQDRTYHLMGSEINMNEANTRYLNKAADVQNAKIDEINKNIDLMSSQISLYDKQGQLLQKELDSFEQRLASELNEAASRVNLNLANAREVASKIALNVANAQKAYADAMLSSAQTESLALTNYLDGVKLAIISGDMGLTYEIANNEINLELKQARAASARSESDYEEANADLSMWRKANDDVISFLRALTGGRGVSTNFGVSGRGVRIKR